MANPAPLQALLALIAARELPNWRAVQPMSSEEMAIVCCFCGQIRSAYRSIDGNKACLDCAEHLFEHLALR